MADWLLLRLPRAAGEPASWLIADARGAPAGPAQGGPWTLAAARAPGRRVCALVPGADVLLAEPEIPVKAGAKLQQLVPYALEEQLADDIDDLHFAIGKRAGDSARAPVAVVARALLDEWLATLRASGLEPEAIYADSELLPHNPGQAVVLLEEDAVLVRSPGACPVTLPADALGEALEIAQSGAQAPPSGARGLILYTGAAEWQRHSAQIEAARARFDGIKIQLLTGGPLALFAQQLPAATPIHPLQALAQARDATPGMSVQALQFHGGALDMKLSAPDAASLDRVSQALRNSGWQADLTGGGNAPSGYEGHIQVRAGGT